MKSKERQAAYNKTYYAKNKLVLNDRSRAYYHANIERAVAASKLHYARVHSDPYTRAGYLIRAARARAKRKGLAFDICPGDIAWQIELGVCAATGIQFHLATNQGRHPFTPSIDRIDNNQGYIRGNVRIIVWALNAMRGDWGDDILMRIADTLRRAV